ncbi:MAG: hypothetical protein J0I77_01860 [Rudaea sp.]|uniref:hypothetical protein n=1 Tax=unclassified Rudaea TaxID=2627037 RepID=UPI0010F69AB8|nr:MULTISPECIES: hypothetical protein [unclassified Rudaea]MBN8884440.1 hypothetical protein [Rudaea sp.]
MNASKMAKLAKKDGVLIWDGMGSLPDMETHGPWPFLIRVMPSGILEGLTLSDIETAVRAVSDHKPQGECLDCTDSSRKVISGDHHPKA